MGYITTPQLSTFYPHRWLYLKQIYPIGDDIISPQVVILYILYILIIRHLQHPIHIDIFIDTNKTIIDISVGESSF